MPRWGYFIALGITLHNLPEGIAIGATSEVSYHMGIMTALTIGLHNIAEGLCVAMPLCLANVRKSRVVLITTMTGMSTLLGTGLGMILGLISPLIIAFFLAFAAGAMIYISSDELIPKSHHSHSEYANVGIMLGFILALILS
ncbi:ZIP family metal transporter [Dehalobacter sp. UNSWDHB]|uniref:ZIP family metal transporter n=1 Tax=Dehalobacter sp. UNSWDHB TaxID=1339256 RepID=UPI0003FFD68D|nr:ZIP family metal transporter [Dehalobacter sp. UNSWDHB]